ncbi:MAG: pyruvate dehydrogenase [Planctomycetaceae bacterium]|nr:pyruvate dehydrogenase [Planctomycetaceae bacterium]
MDSSSNATESLNRIQRRVLWLAVQQIQHANTGRPKSDQMKVGGHQASCASVVTIMTTLFFRFMRSGDLISVKPHASPVLHAIQYLLGNLDASYLKRLRDCGGLQAYPSRTKDPDQVDFSTGSVGLGAVAPNFAGVVDTYLRTHQLGMSDVNRRFISLVGDAELDEGSVWEAIAEPAMAGVNDVLWIVDLNRQSLDRVIPGIRVRCWREMFAANGWDVIDAKYGRLMQAAFDEPNGELLRICVDELSNDAFQRLLRLQPSDLREWLPRKSRYPQELRRLLDRWDDAQLHDLFWNLGGHDIEELEAALAKTTRQPGPSVIFAYTLKGWKLPSVGHAQNHSVLLSDEQMESLRSDLEIPVEETWSGFSLDSAEREQCEQVSRRLFGGSPKAVPAAVKIPNELSTTYQSLRSTQQTFGTILSTLARECPELVRRVVTVSPDVASSTNLGGWINKHEVWRLTEQEELPENTSPGILQWTESTRGQHIELGISENNLFLMLGQLGLSHELFGQLLFPIGTLYDPFIRRGLDALFYSVYSGAKFIAVGTPSGVTLASEGGAHQSLMTPSIGTELPDVVSYEPCFAQELEWIMMDSLARIQRRGTSSYLRLTTKRIDQALFPDCTDPTQREQLRTQVLAGAYRLHDCRDQAGYEPDQNVVHLFACGAMVPEALAAQRLLSEEGIFVNVFNVTGPGPLYSSFQQASHAAVDGMVSESNVFDQLVPTDDREAPVVTLTDAHPHSLAWIGSALGTRVLPLGVVEFGQSGSLDQIYRKHQIDRDSIVAACLAALKSTTPDHRTGDARD